MVSTAEDWSVADVVTPECAPPLQIGHVVSSSSSPSFTASKLAPLNKTGGGASLSGSTGVGGVSFKCAAPPVTGSLSIADLFGDLWCCFEITFSAFRAKTRQPFKKRELRVHLKTLNKFTVRLSQTPTLAHRHGTVGVCRPTGHHSSCYHSYGLCVVWN
jgi:hypothetical protein